MARDKGIKLSPKHGVNPTLAVCAWCGEETGEVVLLGKLPNDEEAPRHMVFGYEPCPKCAEQWNKGIAFIEVEPLSVDSPKMPISVQNGIRYVPTGRLAVLTEEGTNNVLKEKDKKAGDRLLMDKETFETLFNNAL